MLKFFEGVSFSSPMIHAAFEGALSGTFVLLRGQLSDPSLPPLTLKNIVLAKMLSFKEGMTRNEILGTLLQEIG